MGNNDSKQVKVFRRIPASEVRSLVTRLGLKSEADFVSEEKLENKLSWKELNNPLPTQIWALVSKGHQSAPLSSFLDLIDAMVFQDHSSAAQYMSQFLPETPLESAIKTYANNINFIFQMHKSSASETWQSQGVSMGGNTVDKLVSNQFIESLNAISGADNVERIGKWLEKQTLFFLMQKIAFCHLFHVSVPEDTIPQLTSSFNSKSVPTVLDLCDILFINHSLPHDLRSEWALLFSTHIHGQSFTSMLAKLTNKGPTLIIVEDSQQHVFGGFASESWRIGPKFIGDTKCFLFKLRPFFAVYTSTGYNDHHMYLNIQQQTMPNGLGMGGQLQNFGLWIDADFGKGHSSPGCSTYHHMPSLSSDKDFSIEHVEVWAVGPPPKEDSDDETDGKRSILDKDSGAKAILEMVDRGHHSEGLREIPDEEY
ncbi:MTOR-associated protein MEAK7 [Frankliniella fusca]|uniref:MTOR-associated protein MEAK7 n=1 Tax=Frankliniella fusca TaxID=407009 RepID=A0AAE1HS06_9NEOP|nr:MTOR-associated protein MEAK7 [Frankliniella fusca]